MSSRIAWVRLITYIGSSIIFVLELYRLILTYLRFIIQIPALYAILEALMLWGIFFGYLCLNFGFYNMYKDNYLLLNSENYSFPILKNSIYFGAFIDILVFLLVLSPPLDIVSSSFTDRFYLMKSILWILYYFSILCWVLLIWSFIHNKKVTDIVGIPRMVIHSFLGILLILILTIDFFAKLIFTQSILQLFIIFALYLVVLVFFILFQAYFFFRVTRFALLVHG